MISRGPGASAAAAARTQASPEAGRSGGGGYGGGLRTAGRARAPTTEGAGSNGINVGAAEGVAWVAEQVSPRHDYCADPATGRVLGRIPLPDPEQDYVLAIDGPY